MAEPPARKNPLPVLRIAGGFASFALIAGVIITAINTDFFGLITIRGESYYPEVVKRITTDRAFIAALGSPIAVDANGIRCDQKTFDSAGITATADCELPVSGPKGSGKVHAQILKRPDALDADFFLHVGNQVIRNTN
jgi:hypothetical protein